jgi:MFS family permease
MTSQDDQPAYRWVIVFASALILSIAMGSIVNGMAAYVVPMQEVHGWKRGDVSLINFSGIMGLALGGLIMGTLADRLGTRPVVLFGVSILGLCYVAASWVTVLWQLYALFFVAGFLGAGAIYPPIMAAVGNWFSTGAGLAIGIAAAGQALGQGGVPFASSHLIEAFGIDGALRLTGLFMLVAMIPLAALLSQPPALAATQQSARALEEAGALPVNVVVFRLSLAIVLCCTCMSTPLMHLVPLIQDRGIQSNDASSVIFVMLLIGIAGRVAFGKLADVIGALPAYFSATAWMSLMVFGFIYVLDLKMFYVYASIYGFGYAGVMTGVLVSIRMLTPPSRRAWAFGIVSMFGWFGHAIGGYQGGVLYDLTGDYTAPYAIAALAGIANLFIVGSLFLKLRHHKQQAVQI